jgi:hypothetical protein
MQEVILGAVLHALPVACAAWTLTHEEIFREWWEGCSSRSQKHKKEYLYEKKLYREYNDGSFAKLSWHWLMHKLCFLFTCEYCVSHWLALILLNVTGYRLYYEGWLGFGMAFFSVPWLAVLMMDIHQRLRVVIRKERVEADGQEKSNGKTGV